MERSRLTLRCFIINDLRQSRPKAVEHVHHGRHRAKIRALIDSLDVGQCSQVEIVPVNGLPVIAEQAD
ncbi:hypothetical protein RSP795_23760 [Ralstonia solanacearum]|nr:hypothetical protein RSP795_23760 [Ralstonia solanacearum]